MAYCLVVFVVVLVVIFVFIENYGDFVFVGCKLCGARQALYSAVYPTTSSSSTEIFNRCNKVSFSEASIKHG